MNFKDLLPFIAGTVFSIAACYVLYILWNKKKSKIVKIFIVLGWVGSIWLGLFSITNGYVSYERYQELKPKKVEQLRDVRLGWDMPELIFRKGKPSAKEAQNKDADGNEFNLLVYPDMYVVTSKEDKVVKIVAVCDEERTLENIYLANFGIECKTTVDSMISILGEPDFISASDNGEIRMFSYPKYNLSYALKKGEVIAVQVYDPKTYGNGIRFSKESSSKSDKSKM